AHDDASPPFHLFSPAFGEDKVMLGPDDGRPRPRGALALPERDGRGGDFRGPAPASQAARLLRLDMRRDGQTEPTPTPTSAPTSTWKHGARGGARPHRLGGGGRLRHRPE